MDEESLSSLTSYSTTSGSDSTTELEEGENDYLPGDWQKEYPWKKFPFKEHYDMAGLRAGGKARKERQEKRRRHAEAAATSAQEAGPSSSSLKKPKKKKPKPNRMASVRPKPSVVFNLGSSDSDVDDISDKMADASINPPAAYSTTSGSDSTTELEEGENDFLPGDWQKEYPWKKIPLKEHYDEAGLRAGGKAREERPEERRRAEAAATSAQEAGPSSSSSLKTPEEKASNATDLALSSTKKRKQSDANETAAPSLPKKSKEGNKAMETELTAAAPPATTEATDPSSLTGSLKDVLLKIIKPASIRQRRETITAFKELLSELKDDNDDDHNDGDPQIETADKANAALPLPQMPQNKTNDAADGAVAAEIAHHEITHSVVGLIQLGKLTDERFNQLVAENRVYAKDGCLYIKESERMPNISGIALTNEI